MLKQFYQVNEEGYITKTVVLNDEYVPPFHFEGWGEGIEEPRWDFEKKCWVESRDLEEQLAEYKKRKFAELDARCSQEITGYFKAEVNGQVYDFSFDAEAQGNFMGSMTLLDRGLIDKVEWTAWQNGEVRRIKMDRDQLTTVALTGFKHKDAKVYRLRNILEPTLNGYTSVEQVIALNWDSDVPDPSVEE